MKRFTQIDRNKGTIGDLGLVIILSVCLATLWHVALLDRCAFVAHILVAPHWYDTGLSNMQAVWFFGHLQVLVSLR